MKSIKHRALRLVAAAALVLGVSSVATPNAAAYPWDPAVFVQGPINCFKGPVVGAWYKTGTGEQGWANVFLKDGAPWYSIQLRSVPKYNVILSVNIGCGGTPQRWGSTVRATTMVWRPGTTNWFPQGLKCYQQGTNLQAGLISNNSSISCNQYV